MNGEEFKERLMNLLEDLKDEQLIFLSKRLDILLDLDGA